MKLHGLVFVLVLVLSATEKSDALFGSPIFSSDFVENFKILLQNIAKKAVEAG